MATVITNLMSAIPWVGQDIVEFIWGGLNTVEPHNGNVMLKILLNAGTSSTIVIAYVLIVSNSYVKIAMARRQSAGVRKLHTFEASQRLNAGDPIYAYIVGLIEGDGYFSITKKGEYLSYEFGIELSIKDVQLLHKVKNLLGVGTLSFRTKNNNEMIIFRIRNKDHLKGIIIPIFDRYPMYSNKHYDFLRFKSNLLSNVTRYENLERYIRPIEPLNSIEHILNSSYLSSWLVGFIEAEGCFSSYKATASGYDIMSFDIAQKDGNMVISAIAKYLSFTTKIHLDNTGCYKLKATSVRSISSIVGFINKAPVKLLGNKKLQFVLWLKKLRTISRYSSTINIPSNY